MFIALIQHVHATLARVVTPVCPNDLDDVAALDDVIQALVDPRMLHHPTLRVQGLALACLREALRVCRLDDSGADAAAAAGEADADADEAGDAQGERGTSARDSPRTPSDESQSPYSSSSSAELSLLARRAPQDSALQAMVRLSPLCSALLRLERGPDRGGRGLSILTASSFVTSLGTEERSSGAQPEARANAACVRRELAPRQHGDASSHQVRTNAPLCPSLLRKCSLLVSSRCGLCLQGEGLEQHSAGSASRVASNTQDRTRPMPHFQLSIRTNPLYLGL